jgi:hypothetical protein
MALGSISPIDQRSSLFSIGSGGLGCETLEILVQERRGRSPEAKIKSGYLDASICIWFPRLLISGTNSKVTFDV